MPKAGGYFDQDPRLMEDFLTLLLVRKAVAARRDSPPATGINISKMEHPPI